jgi:hypothetical protein
LDFSFQRTFSRSLAVESQNTARLRRNKMQAMSIAVSTGVILTHCTGVKVTHLGEDGSFLEAADVDPGASSGDTSYGPTGRGIEGDCAAGRMLA